MTFRYSITILDSFYVKQYLFHRLRNRNKAENSIFWIN